MHHHRPLPLCSALLLAGCGGSDSGISTPAPIALASARADSVAAASSQARYSYTLTDLGIFTAYGIDDQDNVVGEIDTANIHAVIYSGGQLTLLPDTDYSTAYAVNNGVIAGFSDTQVAEWQSNTLTNLIAGSGHAYAVNSSGTVVGTELLANGAYNIAYAMIWQNGAATDLGANTDARAVNALGNVAGTVSDPSTNLGSAFFYNAGTLIQIGTLQCGSGATFGSQGLGLNASNAVVGNSCSGAAVVDPLSGESGVPSHAFLYLNGQFTDLGVLDTDPTYGPASDSGANAVDDLNEVVGFSDANRGAEYPQNLQHAFIYTSQMYDLNSLLATPNSSIVLTNATGINCNSDIVVNGLNLADGQYHAYLLTRIGARQSQCPS